MRSEPNRRDPRSPPLAILKPSDVSSRIGFFDRFAGVAAKIASRAPFFAFGLFLADGSFRSNQALQHELVGAVSASGR